VFDTSKLKGRIIEMYGTQGAFAKAIGRTDTYVSLVLKGRVLPRTDEVDRWCTALEIDTEDIGAFFYTPKLCET